MSEGAPFIRVRGITKAYPGVVAIEHADLDLDRGEIVGLVGKNGSGKSTLIKILAAVVQPDGGRIEVDGEPVSLRHVVDAHRLGFTFVHQELVDFTDLSVAENIALAGGLPTRGPGLVKWRELRRRARAILTDLDLDIGIDTRLDELSVAERRMVMIASVLYREARLVVLDEPTASLTEPEVRQLQRMMSTLRESGVSLLFVSHRLEEIFGFCDRVIVMRDGLTVAASSVSDIGHDGLLRHITGDADAVSVEGRQLAPDSVRESEELLRLERLVVEGGSEEISFSLAAGEVMGLAGLVGSGRTELVRAVVGADPAAAGEAFVNGEPVRISSPADALSCGIALLPEDRRHQGLISTFGIRANITLPSLAWFRRVGWLPFPSRDREARSVWELLGQVEVEAPDIEKPVLQLSGGTQQKVMLARWLLRDARVLIFDEPTHGIDVHAKESLFELIVSLANAGKGVIFISSDLKEMERVCHRALVLREGRAVGFLPQEELSEESILARCYGQ